MKKWLLFLLFAVAMVFITIPDASERMTTAGYVMLGIWYGGMFFIEEE